MDTQQVVEFARQYVDVKWRHQGRNPKRGIDCAGLIVCVARDLGLDTSWDRTDYGRRSSSMEFVKYFKENMIEKKVVGNDWDKTIQEGDVLILKESRYPCHTAIVGVKNGFTMIHGYALHRRVVEEPYTEQWKRLTTHCFSFREV